MQSYRLVLIASRGCVEIITWPTGAGDASKIRLRHGNEVDPNGIGVGPVIRYPDTDTGRERARMYLNLLRAKER
jgi:hypothetical protein